MVSSEGDSVSATVSTRPRGLSLLVLVAGSASLATEMGCARLLAPYFGTSNVVWANVIGLILIYLSVGYWLGGKLADRHPDARSLGLVALVAAASIALLPFVTKPLFSAASRAFTDVDVGVYLGSFLATVLTFALPVTAMGAISPWAIRLAVRNVGEAGTVAGRLYALSTMGSILGTFVSVLLLIPAIGTQRTLLCFAVALSAVATLNLPRRALVVPVIIGAMLLIPPGHLRRTAGQTVLFEKESAYQYVQVVQETSGERVLYLNEGWARHSVKPAAGVLTGGYWDAFAAMPSIVGRADGTVAVLGNAGGTIGNIYAEAWPQMRTDGVEIDPVVTKVAREYLGMTSPSITVHTADARPWLAATSRRFDVIVADAYRQPYIPFHLATQEFFQLTKDRLNPGGVLAVNVGTPPKQTAIVDRITATMRTVYPTVLGIRYDNFNTILIGLPSARSLGDVQARLRATSGLASPAAHLLADGLVAEVGSGNAFTDDHAPVEWLTDRALLDYLRDGAPGARRSK